MVKSHCRLIVAIDFLNYCFIYEGIGHSTKQYLLNFPQLCTTVRFNYHGTMFTLVLQSCYVDKYNSIVLFFCRACIVSTDAVLIKWLLAVNNITGQTLQKLLHMHNQAPYSYIQPFVQSSFLMAAYRFIMESLQCLLTSQKAIQIL